MLELSNRMFSITRLKIHFAEASMDPRIDRSLDIVFHLAVEGDSHPAVKVSSSVASTPVSNLIEPLEPFLDCRLRCLDGEFFD